MELYFLVCNNEDKRDLIWRFMHQIQIWIKTKYFPLWVQHLSFHAYGTALICTSTTIITARVLLKNYNISHIFHLYKTV